MDFKEDFPMLNKDIVYLDNAATTFKPNIVIEEEMDYYKNYCANLNRGTYDIGIKASRKYEETRDKVASFINAEKSNEIIFTSGATDSLNMIVNGFFANYLKAKDEILTTKAEHASLILPWYKVAYKTGAIVKYIDLENDLSVTLENVKKGITSKTKVISLAHITNVIGDIRPIEEITKLAHELGILVVIDGAQSVPHTKIDVQKQDIDFLAFSAHKMLGPTGVGVLYGKEKYLNKLLPTNVGGGMNLYFDSLMNVTYKKLPVRLEAGTPNIVGVIAFNKAISYIEKLGIENIHKYEVDLKKYLVSKLSLNKNIIMYNKDIENGMLTFNVKDVINSKVVSYLNKNNVCIRAGNHCAKTLSEVLGVKNTCRVSLYFYNTKEDIDKLVYLLLPENINANV